MKRGKIICPKCGSDDWFVGGIRDTYDSSVNLVESVTMVYDPTRRCASKKCNNCGHLGAFVVEGEELNEKDLEILKEAQEIAAELADRSD